MGNSQTSSSEAEISVVKTKDEEKSEDFFGRIFQCCGRRSMEFVEENKEDERETKIKEKLESIRSLKKKKRNESAVEFKEVNDDLNFKSTDLDSSKSNKNKDNNNYNKIKKQNKKGNNNDNSNSNFYNVNSNVINNENNGNNIIEEKDKNLNIIETDTCSNDLPLDPEILTSTDPYLKKLIRDINWSEVPTTNLIEDTASIRKDEKEIFQFTIPFILKTYDNWMDDPNFTDLYKKDNDPLYVRFNRAGSCLNNNLYLGYHVYSLDITNLKNVTLDVVKSILGNPDYIGWDSNIKSFEVIKQSTTSISNNSNNNNNNSNGINNNSLDVDFCIFRKHFNSPLFIVSERDRVDKMVSFKIKDVVFSFSSSVEDNDYCQEVKGVVRVKNFVSLYAMRIEEDLESMKRNLVVSGFNQLDPKMPLPEWIFNITIPMKTKQWYQLIYTALEIYDKEGFDGLIKLKKN